MFSNYLQLEDKRGKETKGGQCLTIHESRWREHRRSLGYDFRFPVAWRLAQSQRQRRQQGRAIRSPGLGGWCEDLTSGPIAIPRHGLCDLREGIPPRLSLLICTTGIITEPRIHPLSQYLPTVSAKENRGADDGSHWALDEVPELLKQLSRNSPTCRLSIVWGNSPPYKPL